MRFKLLVDNKTIIIQHGNSTILWVSAELNQMHLAVFTRHPIIESLRKVYNRIDIINCISDFNIFIIAYLITSFIFL